MKRENYLTQYSKKLREQTIWEAKLWRHLRAHRFYGLKFKRQVAIERYIVDFCCNEKKVIIELDGGFHRGSRAEDIQRDQFFLERGYQVFRFWNSELETIYRGIFNSNKSTSL